jgi:hypothetical protein
LFNRITLQWLFVIDVLSFGAAFLTIAIIRVPAASENRIADEQSIDFGYGWRYIAERPGLVGLLVFYAITNYVYGVAYSLVTPLLLSTASENTLGRAQAIMSLGALSGGAVMTLWRGPRSRVICIFLFELALSAGIALAGLFPSVEMITFGGFLVCLSVSVVMTCSQSIWQSKVAPSVQGRVFSVRYMVACAALPLAYATAGPLAEFAFDGGGGNPGSRFSQEGVRLMLLCAAIVNVIAIVWAYLNPRIRLLESELPDTLYPDIAVENSAVGADR